ncbi:MAG: alpha/beta hydrolase [Solirubrobacteraceae bacterium]|nr:alpha/beta hydrolase [Solirubrobacteraceae bacterium]
MPQVKLDQGRIAYEQAGPPAAESSAPPVVFVHGFLVSGTLWSGVAEALAAAGITSYAPTLPLGSHTTAMDPGADLSPRGVARLVIAFLERLDLRDVTLVGNDSGGAITQFVLDTDASRVGRVVLTNCDAFTNFPPAPFALLFRIAALPGAALPMLTPMRLRALRHSALGFGLLVDGTLDPAQTRAWVDPALRDAGVRRDVRAFLRAVDPAELDDVATRLHRFPGPVLLCWAPADRFFTIETARRLQEVFADARLVEVPDSKTFVPLDQPERVAAEIAAFSGVSRTSTPSAVGLANR